MQSGVGEHATFGGVESDMWVVRKRTRTLKNALEAHVRKIVEAHSVFGRDGVTTESDVPNVLGRNSLRGLENQSQVECNPNYLLVGILGTTHASASSHHDE